MYLDARMQVQVSGDGLAMGFQAVAQSTTCSFQVRYSLLSLMLSPHPSLYLRRFKPMQYIEPLVFMSIPYTIVCQSLSELNKFRLVNMNVCATTHLILHDCTLIRTTESGRSIRRCLYEYRLDRSYYCSNSRTANRNDIFELRFN